jgi:hypothetical protein
MERLLWSLALVGTFIAGWAAAGVVLKSSTLAPDVAELQDTVTRLEQQVVTLQARLRARDTLAAPRSSPTPTGSADATPSARPAPGSIAGPGPRLLAGAVAQDRTAGSDPGTPATRAPAPGGSGPAGAPATVEQALDRFYRYLEATAGADRGENWRQARELVNELRAMGAPAGQALMHVLASGTDSDERRAAARLLGSLQVPQAVPLLRDIIDREDDLLLRRAAAAGLRQVQTPEAVPVMERLLTNPGEDRFVRLSAAYGLAQSGKPAGVVGLTQIFDESTADGRGREMAFRALASLKDERPLPFMRQVVTSQAEPSFRLQAIRYLTAQGDRQALGALQAVMNSPREQPSIRDAATQAYATLSAR